MQFRHKIRKLVDGQSLASARKRTLRLLRPKRFQLDTKRVIETIDPVEFEQIRRRYRVADPGADWPKYLDLDRWIGVNIRRIRQLELDVARPKQILDLGCGAGYFLYIAQLLGHSGIGLDMDRLSMFREITQLLGVRRVVQRIDAFRPLPNFSQKFDVITAFMICFNNHKMPALWGVPDAKTDPEIVVIIAEESVLRFLAKLTPFLPSISAGTRLLDLDSFSVST